jgi:hypothetical protein
MPKAYVEPTINGPVSRQLLSGGVVELVSSSLISNGSLECPVTVRRTKPTDLFAGGTARTVNVFKYRFDKGVWNASGYSWTGPCSYFMSVGNDGSLNGHPSSSSMDGRIRAKIKKQNVNLAQTLAEYRQTSKMFVDLATDVVKTFRSLRGGRAFGDFVRLLRRPRDKHELALANRWLQYQYGIKPLMSDLYGSAEALATKIRTGFFMYVGVTAHENFQNRYVQNSSVHPNMKIQYDSSYQWHGSARARYKISDPALKQLAQLGITNPALLLWELIPYSFVIDWLIPVGKFLESLDALVGVSDLRVRRGYKIIKEFKGESSGMHGLYQISTSNRGDVTTSLAFPKFSYEPSKSLKSVVNGVALLLQLRK